MTQPGPICSQWTTPELVRACCGGLGESQDLTAAIQFASATLFRLSGRRWPGLCDRTVWPCRSSSCSSGEPMWDVLAASDWHWSLGGVHPSAPGRVAGGWENCWGCGCGGDSCNQPFVDLPDYTSDVIQVVVGGQVLPSSAYVIQDNRRLVRVDGGSWPCSNTHAYPVVFADVEYELMLPDFPGDFTLSVTLDDGETTELAIEGSSVDEASVSAALGTVFDPTTFVVDQNEGQFIILFDTASLSGLVTLGFEGDGELTLTNDGAVPSSSSFYIHYMAGPEPPPDGAYAASVFACQMALGQCGSEFCRLPARLRTIAREGVTMTMADPLEFLEKGQTGIYEVDLWLHSVNPFRLQRRPGVYRADAGQGPRQYR